MLSTERAQRILNEAAGWEKYSLAEAGEICAVLSEIARVDVVTRKRKTHVAETSDTVHAGQHRRAG